MSIVYNGPSGPSGLVTASNGLTATGSDVELGGTLDQPTDIELNGKYLQIDDTASQLVFQMNKLAGELLITSLGGRFKIANNEVRLSDVTQSYGMLINTTGVDFFSGTSFIKLLASGEVDIQSSTPIGTKNLYVVESIFTGTASAAGVVASQVAEANKMYRVTVSFNVTSNTNSISGTLSYTDPEGFAQSFLVVQVQVGAGCIDTLPRIILAEAASGINVTLNITGVATVEYVVVYESIQYF